MFYLYVVECSDGTLYTGIARDIETRLQEHNRGSGAKYTRSRLPVRLLARRPFPTRSAALRAEAALKRLPRAEKLRACEDFKNFCFI